MSWWHDQETCQVPSRAGCLLVPNKAAKHVMKYPVIEVGYGLFRLCMSAWGMVVYERVGYGLFRGCMSGWGMVVYARVGYGLFRWCMSAWGMVVYERVGYGLFRLCMSAWGMACEGRAFVVVNHTMVVSWDGTLSCVATLPALSAASTPCAPQQPFAAAADPSGVVPSLPGVVSAAARPDVAAAQLPRRLLQPPQWQTATLSASSAERPPTPPPALGA
eukprot:365321-Chlamydomonas_euryale.AAC.15